MSAGVRAGYKQTDVGVIPEDWAITTLGEITATSSGTTPARDQADRYYRNGTIHWVKTLDLNNSQITTTDEQVTCLAVDETSLRPYPVGTVLVAMYGGFNQIGRTGLLRIPAAVNQAITAIQPNLSKLNPEFLLAVLNFKVEYWKAVASSSRKDPNITSQDVRAFPLSLPRPDEQRAIATALSDVDALLSGLDSLIAKKQNLKQAAMQQLLTGQTRLPGFSGEWEVKTMKSLGQTYGGLTGKTKEDFGHGSSKYIPFMNVMKDTVIDPEWLETVDVVPSEAQNLAKKGDLFFNGSSETPEEVGFCSVLLADIPNLYLNSFSFGFRFNSEAKVNGLFFAYWFRCADGRTAMSVLAQGATRYNIAKSAFMRLSIPQPTQEEQTAIATVLSDMDTELAALQARRDKTRALKQGMMQELLTGRIRLV